MSTAILEVQALSKGFQASGRNIQALKSVSLSLKQGEFLGISGPSGCGKSTLARCILRLIEPDAGRVTVAGVNWLDLDPSSLRSHRRDMQMVFQNSSEAFNRLATVEEVITEPLRIHQLVTAASYRDEVIELLQRVGLSDNLLSRKVATLSGGQRQRVGIARALACRPKILILDEAVSALDMIAKRLILELLAKLQRESGLSALFISHDLAAIQALCQRIVIMDAGTIIEEGETKELIAQPQHPLTRSLIDAVPSLEF